MRVEGVDDVFWIEGSSPPKLAVVLCPRGDGELRYDLMHIHESGVETLVSLLDGNEARWLGLGDEGRLAEEVGLRFLSFPILDVHVPANTKTFRDFVSGLADRLRAGERIGMHCRGSIGRAPLTAACTMIHLGWKPRDAIAAIQAARGYPVPDTEEQRRWILNYKAEA